MKKKRARGKRIVAGLEDENGKPISPDAIDDFEADCYPAEMMIELLENEPA